MRTARMLGLILCLTSPGIAVSQVDAPFPNVSRFGIIGSLNLATLAGSDVQRADRRTGFMGGMLLSFPLSGGFAIQPEAFFTMKGAAGNSTPLRWAAKVNYIETPVLLRFNVPATGGVKPFAYAGPSVAVKLSCDVEALLPPTASPSPGGGVVSLSCDDFQRQFVGLGRTVSAFDGGAVFGGGLAFNVGGKVLSLGARYEIGFVDIVSASDSKNRVLSFVCTFEWPFHP